MSNVKANIVILLVVFFTTNGAFTQSTEQGIGKRFGKFFFNKKNSLTYQTGLFNYFYDKNPTFMNVFELKNVSRPRHFTETVLIKSRSLSYTRRFKNMSNISFVVGKFYGFFGKNELISDNSKFPIVTNRTWRFISLEYNQLFLEKSKFKLYYGGGLKYRVGHESYKVVQFQTSGGWGEVIGEATRVKEIGAILNMNMRYSFWKRFFFYSKIDIQGYFYQADVVTQDFKELNDKWSTREFEPSSRINHTLTIGIGVDF